ncbi:ABC transporter permease [Streptomyces globisporus]
MTSDRLAARVRALPPIVADLLVVAVVGVFTTADAAVDEPGYRQADETVLGGSLTLSVVAQMLAAVVGALVVTGEYSSGTIRTTFAARPRRSTVLAAKAALMAGVMYVLALASCTLAYLVGDALLPEGRYAQGEPLPALFGPLFGDAERWIGGLSPTASLAKLVQTSDAADTVGSLGPWPSLLLVAAYTTALALGALVLLRRRDV